MEEEDEKPPTTTTFTTLVFLLFLSSTTLADDGDIMFELRSSFQPTPPNWSGKDPCKWDGVRCNTAGQVFSINLASKAVHGTLASNVTNLTFLQSLSLQRNHLSGHVPPLSDMPQLREVYLDDNDFTNIDFPFLSNLPSLQMFSIEDNPLAVWSIPDSLSNSTSLISFHAANASINGTIPDIFATMQSLRDLRLSYNDLTGSLPSTLSESTLQNLWINNQNQGLSGELLVLETMTGLLQVWVHGNSFVGPVPDLSNCTSLYDLQLRDNRLTGIIPSSISNLPKLLNISLQTNKFLGPMPSFGKGVKVTLGTTNSFCLTTPGPCDPQVTVLLVIASEFGYPSVLTDSWQGNDACNGWVHVTCDSSGKVSVLNFAKLGLIGPISSAFANLTSLNSIVLNGNDLYGTIPEALATLQMLRKLDLSNNNLTGKVPKFPDGVSVLVDGNPFVGTDVNTSSSVPPSVLYSRQDGSSKVSSSRLSSFEIIAIVVGVIILLVASGLVIYRISKRKKAKVYGEVESLKKGKGKSGKGNKVEALRMSAIEEFPPQGSPTEACSMLNNIHTFFDHGSLIPIEVLRDVTQNFNEKNILGRGGFGIVYKGVLQDGTQIAVKRMEGNLQGSKGTGEFEAEIAVLSKVRHRHLVALLGYCVTKNERIVVYEYMPQGTLGQHLFECNDETGGFSPLTWMQRLVIALDVARGVEYLHSLAQQSFIHRDLKPSNILLGGTMRAKVSDFGLVKSAPDQGKYSVETRLAGTFGYLAPEYAATGRVTTKVDVFAFGVVLMELITGRKALDERLPEEQAQLVNWFRRVLIAKENIRKALDPHLETDDESVFDSICKVAELSGHCTTREPLQRPDMSHAVNILSPLVNQWRPTEVDGNDSMDDDNDMSLPQALQRWQAGETTTMSEYSINDSQNYYLSRGTTPAMDESFTNIQGR